jgi:hypothetical protein
MPNGYYIVAAITLPQSREWNATMDQAAAPLG